MPERTRKPYPSDLTDEQWSILIPLIPPKIGRGENRKVNLREVFNAILYLVRTGCQWNYLPHDFPPTGTVYYYFDKWKQDGTLDVGDKASAGGNKRVLCDSQALGGGADVCADRQASPHIERLRTKH